MLGSPPVAATYPSPVRHTLLALGHTLLALGHTLLALGHTLLALSHTPQARTVLLGCWHALEALAFLCLAFFVLTELSGGRER